VSLNEETTEKPYVAGRLFSIFEQLQEEANPGINMTIKYKYLNLTCETPKKMFPLIKNIVFPCLSRLNKERRNYFEEQIGALMDKSDKRIKKTSGLRLHQRQAHL